MSARFGTVVLTGATSGIGRATARRLASVSEVLILQGPAGDGGVVDELAGSRATVRYLECDFTSLDAVGSLANGIRRLAPAGIDLLVNDAAVPGAPSRELTPDGMERTLQVNALAPALLTRLLVPSLAPGARIVNVVSSAHRVERFDFDDIDLDRGYSPIAAYARSKLAEVTWSALLAEEERGTGTTVIALCPGLNDTPLSAAMMGRIGGSPEHGADRVMFAATADAPTGSYLENDEVVAPSADARDPRNRARLTALYTQRLRPFADRARS